LNWLDAFDEQATGSSWEPERKSYLQRWLARSVFSVVRDGQHVVYIVRVQGPSSVTAFEQRRKKSALHTPNCYLHMHIYFSKQLQPTS
jgi:hypothetical protein